uniref:NELF-A N-terminal domain-containing protein n=1 Tax=Capra hircus TaxID=9925 RepID=A0A8C2XX81_CAPHI
MASMRESDTGLWLHNKLGATDELWAPPSIASLLTAAKAAPSGASFPSARSLERGPLPCSAWRRVGWMCLFQPSSWVFPALSWTSRCGVVCFV